MLPISPLSTAVCSPTTLPVLLEVLDRADQNPTAESAAEIWANPVHARIFHDVRALDTAHTSGALAAAVRAHLDAEKTTVVTSLAPVVSSNVFRRGWMALSGSAGVVALMGALPLIQSGSLTALIALMAAVLIIPIAWNNHLWTTALAPPAA